MFHRSNLYAMTTFKHSMVILSFLWPTKCTKFSFHSSGQVSLEYSFGQESINISVLLQKHKMNHKILKHTLSKASPLNILKPVFYKAVIMLLYIKNLQFHEIIRKILWDLLTSFSANMSLNCFILISSGTTALCLAAWTSASIAASLLLSMGLASSFASLLSILLVNKTKTIQPCHEKTKVVFGDVRPGYDSNPSAHLQRLARSRDILGTATTGIILSSQRITKALIRLHQCTGWSVPLLFAYGINRFCHDAAQSVSQKWATSWENLSLGFPTR